jgi:hypothetical protein
MEKRPEHESPLIAKILSQERFYKDGPPNWFNAQTSEQASLERKRTAKLLRKHFGQQSALAHKLVGCESHHRCLSGACTECTRALQRWLVCEATQKPLHPQAGLQWVSMVVACAPVGALHKQSLKALQATAKIFLRGARPIFALGGFDVSFNTVPSKPEGFWCIQLWFQTQKRTWTAAPYVEEEFNVKRPLKTYDWDGRTNAIAYALKNTFVRRASYKTKYRWGRDPHYNTRDLALRVNEKKELLLFLDRQGLHRRLFLIGVRPTLTAEGVKLVRLKTSRNSQSGQNDDLHPQLF